MVSESLFLKGNPSAQLRPALRACYIVCGLPVRYHLHSGSGQIDASLTFWKPNRQCQRQFNICARVHR